MWSNTAMVPGKNSQFFHRSRPFPVGVQSPFLDLLLIVKKVAFWGNFNDTTLVPLIVSNSQNFQNAPRVHPYTAKYPCKSNFVTKLNNTLKWSCFFLWTRAIFNDRIIKWNYFPYLNTSRSRESSLINSPPPQ